MPRWRNPFNRRRGLPLYDKPARERHVVSVTCSILSILAMVGALALPEWATSGSSGCDCLYGLTRVYCVNPVSTSGQCESVPMTVYYNTSHEILISCVLSISVLTIISSLVAIIISCGYPREKFEFLRHFSVFNIVSMLCVILVAGFWLAVCETLPIDSQHHSQAAYRGTVRFGYAYYIYIASGVFSLIAASFNLIRARSAAERRRHHRRHYYRQRYLFRSPISPPQTSSLSLIPQRPLQNLTQAAPTGGGEQQEEEEDDNPPEYTQMATTSFIETTDGTEPLLVPNPPPYEP